DAIMAFWGAPVDLEDHAYYACIASLIQMDKLEKLQNSWKERNLPSIDIGIGLNTGYAVVGNMGSSQRMDYTCMGDTINLGSRLEGSNKTYGTNIIISEYTYERVKDRVYARELDLVQVKGKTHPVRIYELIGLVNDDDIKKVTKPIVTTN
ncbi:MAG TPA: adenylate/guanylate cyclase domain-containing protein, partial [Leptospiraceae bacterium]|nr:adenylate/guanylate cyclase domain-containing protein [Leptospiraceae bacterium]